MRLFIAIPLPDKIIKSVSEIQYSLKKRSETAVKWVNPKSIHITLKFLGEVEESTVPTITNSLSKIEVPFHSLDLSLNNIGFFPNPKRPRVIWVGLKGDTENTALLADRIDKSLAKEGFEPESRPFKPHLTLGRFKDNYRLNALLSKVEEISPVSSDIFTSSDFHLYQSILKPSGAEYKVLNSFPL
ncbi:MAG: RNA 2',3'-cyclic phosphodiesterase [Acidobacteria bacterium]|nr:RNA 2',3'-cyclic phosphodiesterase [Acidobacteriota bacterium]